MLRILGTVCYAAAAILILLFIFMNRETVSITLMPLSAPVSAPLYIALAAMFGLGLLIGLIHSALLSLSYGRKLRRQTRALEQVERELSRLAPPGPAA
ncbi:MAG: LapA family protein [Rickettsiales bacterium]